ncbi:MAG TPA: hypothetical protein VMR62_34375 [Bryobacteraceae bacterium]|jgi:hypothetical protein|nr:hypothetical protein [Bryobacteraceae bacterium]
MADFAKVNANESLWYLATSRERIGKIFWAASRFGRSGGNYDGDAAVPAEYAGVRLERYRSRGGEPTL